MNGLREIADDLWTARVDNRPCAPVRDRIGAIAATAGITDLVGVAYDVQRINTDRSLAGGRRLVGKKIGLTSPAVQKQLGVDQPDFGVLFADMACDDGAEIAWCDVLQPRIEAEIALVLEHDLQGANSVADVVRATAYIVPALEICGSRIAAWDIGIVDTVADNASAGSFVLGAQPIILGDLDLAVCGMSMARDGAVVSTGAGAACLGNPLNAALWLANMMAAMGEPLRAGDVVLTGALGPMVACEPGQSFTATIDRVGRVTATFGAE